MKEMEAYRLYTVVPRLVFDTQSFKELWTHTFMDLIRFKDDLSVALLVPGPGTSWMTSQTGALAFYFRSSLDAESTRGYRGQEPKIFNDSRLANLKVYPGVARGRDVCFVPSCHFRVQSRSQIERQNFQKTYSPSSLHKRICISVKARSKRAKPRSSVDRSHGN